MHRSLLTSALVVGLVVLLHHPARTYAQTALPPLPVTVCVTCRVARTPHTQHAEYAARYFAAEWPTLAVTTQLVGVYEAGGTSQRGLIRAYVVNGSRCDVVVGPGSSSIAQAMSPLVDALWMDYSATSTALTNRQDFPWFSRVVPTDADATSGLAVILRTFGWLLVNTLCADTSYGSSVVDGISAAVARLGGTIGLARCVQRTADRAALRVVLQQLMTAESRIVFVGMSSSDGAFAALIDEVLAMNAHRRLIFLFSESACSSNSLSWQRIPGSLCATFALNAAEMSAFLASYAARDTTATDRAYADMGWPSSEVDRAATGVFPAYAVDATRFSLAAYEAYYVQNRTRPASFRDIVAFARARNYTGVTGLIQIPTGNRDAADMTVFSSEPGNVTVVLANVSSAGTATLRPRAYWLDQGYFDINNPPAAIVPADAGSDSDATTTIAIAASASAVALIVVAVAAALVLLRPRGRDNALAPKGATFTVMFTDIQSSTAQWAAAPEVMGPAVDTHHERVRRALRRHNGYEVKTIGDSFMVAFDSPSDAVRCALEIQQDLHSFDWGSEAIDDTYRRTLIAKGIKVPEPGEYEDLWNGLRVRIGIHTGEGDAKLDEVTGGYDYYGTVVNTAARVEGVAHGGQVLVTAATAAQAGDVLNQADVKPLGPQPLRGLSLPVDLTQVLPTALALRTFPDLRLDVENAADNEAEADAASEVSGQSVMMTARSTRSVQYEAENAAEVLLRKLSRRAPVAPATFARFNAVVAASFTPMTPEARLDAVYAMAEAWRLPEARARPNKKATRDQKNIAVDCMIVRLTAKATAVAAEKVDAGGLSINVPQDQLAMSVSANSDHAASGRLTSGMLSLSSPPTSPAHMMRRPPMPPIGSTAVHHPGAVTPPPPPTLQSDG